MHKNNGQVFLKAKLNFLLKKLYARGVTTHHDVPIWEFMIQSHCKVTFSRTPFSSIHPCLSFLIFRMGIVIVLISQDYCEGYACPEIWRMSDKYSLSHECLFLHTTASYLTMALQKYLARPPTMTTPQGVKKWGANPGSNKMLPSLKSLPGDLARASTLG